MTIAASRSGPLLSDHPRRCVVHAVPSLQANVDHALDEVTSIMRQVTHL